MGPDNRSMKISDRVDPAHVQRLLDTLPEPLEPLDASALDGYLCGVEFTSLGNKTRSSIELLVQLLMQGVEPK